MPKPLRIVVGLLITLNILGINLTSLAIFAGALGVGIGLGMQNIANNFISGLILLAERPIRTKEQSRTPTYFTPNYKVGRDN